MGGSYLGFRVSVMYKGASRLYSVMNMGVVGELGAGPLWCYGSMWDSDWQGGVATTASTTWVALMVIQH